MHDEYFDDKPNEKLGMLLSDMNPYLFADLNSADPATWPEWVSCAEGVQKGNVLTAENVFRILIAFLEFNESPYEYDTNEIVEELQKPTRKERWLELIEKAATLKDM